MMPNTDWKPDAMRNVLRRTFAVAFALVLTGCATPRAEPAGVTIVLVRHAEKASDDPRDPNLTDAGRERAQRLAKSLRAAPLRAVYATAFRRTQQTAAPAAAQHAMAVTTYDAARPAEEMAAALRTSHIQGTVLVVGHSNTVPALAQALCECRIEPIADTQFDRRITITTARTGRISLDDRVDP